MSMENEPILNLEQAKHYFIAMGCSHFHLDREDFQRRDEYYTLGISSETEKEWRQQEIERQLSEFPFNISEEIGFRYSQLGDMVKSECKYLPQMLKLADDISEILLFDQIHIILSAIIGTNATLTHGGLIEYACKEGLTDLAQQFAECAQKFINKADINGTSIMFLRGYLVDVITSLSLKDTDEHLKMLREQDNIESFKYYLQCAKEGNRFSMRMLSEHYNDGKGCDIDIDQAKYWQKQSRLLR